MEPDYVGYIPVRGIAGVCRVTRREETGGFFGLSRDSSGRPGLARHRVGKREKSGRRWEFDQV